MDFEIYFARHLSLHPLANAQDILKFCYQRAFGAEHLLLDIDAAKRYFFLEWERMPPSFGEAIEPLSDEIARVHFAPWKAMGGDAERLFDAFVRSARVSNDGKTVFFAELERVNLYLKAHGEETRLAQWQALLEEYDTVSCPSVHHSEAFRDTEKPAYRIVKRCMLEDILPK